WEPPCAGRIVSRLRSPRALICRFGVPPAIARGWLAMTDTAALPKPKLIVRARDRFHGPSDVRSKITGRLTGDRGARTTRREKVLSSGGERLVGDQLELVGHSAELGKRTGFHLLHRPAAMHLYRGFGDADI